jgi:hypothetical protein
MSSPEVVAKPGASIFVVEARGPHDEEPTSSPRSGAARRPAGVARRRRMAAARSPRPEHATTTTRGKELCRRSAWSTATSRLPKPPPRSCRRPSHSPPPALFRVDTATAGTAMRDLGKGTLDPPPRGQICSPGPQPVRPLHQPKTRAPNLHKLGGRKRSLPPPSLPSTGLPASSSGGGRSGNGGGGPGGGGLCATRAALGGRRGGLS